MFFFQIGKNKTIVRTVAILFIFANLFSFVFFALPVKAQLLTSVTADAPAAVKEVKLSWYNAMLSSALGALVNATSYFMRKLAYDAATYVASGGKGQGALAFNKGAGAYFKDVALNSASTAISEFGKSFGLDLCKTPDLRVQMFIQVGLRNLYTLEAYGKGGPQPSCEWNQMSNAWSAEAFEKKYGPGGSKFMAETFSNALRVENTDFGIALGAMGKLDRIKAEAVAGAQSERIEGQGYKSLTNLISGDIKTPAQVIKTETESITAKQQTELTTGQVAGIYGSGALQVIPSAMSVFLNTLTSQLLKKLMTGGLLGGGEGGGGGAADFFAQYGKDSRKAAEQAFSFLFTDVPQKQLNSYNIIAEFAACPDSPSLNNCVIDSGLQQAINRANSGKPITIQQAIDEKLLKANWPLIPPSRVVDNNRDCYKREMYCYSNLQKLRKVRILPLGFELAALKSDPDQPWTLDKVVKGFEDCARDKSGNAYADDQHPFCHLIDPNWVIKSPEARCEAQVYGPLLETSDSNVRKQECVDISTCLSEDEQGTCATRFGYCLREKNIWRIGGKSCADYYNTCSTYFDRAGKAVSYLERTVDFGQCNLESVGCRAYSIEGDGVSWKSSEAIDLGLKEDGRNQTMFFNDNIKNFTCSAKGDGCSLLKRAENNEYGSSVYLKKAPDSLGCYDINTSTDSIEINWPETKLDLAELAKRSEQCENFALACLRDEVGCENYKSKSGGPDIPGIVGENACPSACVGYDTYKQEATKFSAAVFPKYIIPANGQSCSSQYAGCDEFTNIDEVSKGGEGLEYYTDLRYCERPDGQNEKAFYSWEGSSVEGYVLRTHKMLQINSAEAGYISGLSGLSADAKSAFLAGSPSYVDDSLQKLQENYSLCNTVNYKILIDNPYSIDAAHPDCRALYDDAGNVYYRILTETVTVSADCHPLRKTESEMYVDSAIASAQCISKGGDLRNGECWRCYRGGKYENGTCIYWTISKPGESNACPKSANGCRQYIGNTGNNIKQVYFTAFEPDGTDANALAKAKEGWSGNVQIKPEAIQVGQYSLGVTGGADYTFATSTITGQDWYEISFWARGNTQNLYVSLKQGAVENKFTASASLTVSGEWREYHAGSVQFTGSTEKPVILVFDSNSNTQYFLDNVRLTRLQDSAYRIKDSWKTLEGYDAPYPACDDKPDDAFPGSALGCKEYKDSRNNSVYATGFEKLCRPEAIGCQPFYDTYNTNELEKTAYKVWCNKIVDNKCTLTATVNGNIEELGDCSVIKGQSGCFVDKITIPENVQFPSGVAGAKIVTSTVIIPADTPTTTAFYITDRKEFSCNSNNLGCQKTGLEEKVLLNNYGGNSSYNFVPTYIKNDPANYSETLCADNLVGCEEFKSGSEISYFKNPQLTGSALCSYKNNVEKNGVYYSGWFRNAVGRCAISNLICQKDEDCGPSTPLGASKCDLNNLVPCYENYLQIGSSYGIWSNDSANYKGLVGICPASENDCTELVDTADPSASLGAGTAYYVIFNQDLQDKAGDCEGKVGIKDGCILFNKTDQPNKLFNSSETYKNSENTIPKYSSVNPVITGNLDANIILKVDRDRECGEWLACRTATVVYDANNKPQKKCYEYTACDQLAQNGECANWVDNSAEYSIFDEDSYLGRDTSWKGQDYSGYSLFNKFQVNNLISLSFSGDNNLYLAHKITDSILLDEKGKPTAQSCEYAGQKDGLICGFDKGGRCYNSHCIYPLSGSFPDGVATVDAMKNSLESGTCKAYPEKDSPFAFDLTVGKADIKGDEKKTEPFRYEFTSKKSDYEGANICQGSDCSCEYKKTTYKNGIIDYWQSSQSVIPGGICTGGEIGTESVDGKPCISNSDCGDGVCDRKKQEGVFYGLKGFCLEYDLSRPLGQVSDGTANKTLFPCLTWHPQQTSASMVDLYNVEEDAGYNPSTDSNAYGGKVYCAEATGSAKATHDTNMYQFSLMPENELKNFNWLGAKGAGDEPKVYQQRIYTSVQYQLENNDKKSNAIVWRVENPHPWSVFHDWACSSGSPVCPIGTDLNIEEGQPYGVNRELYREEIKKILFSPFVIYDDESDNAGSGNADAFVDDNLMISNKIYIDIDLFNNLSANNNLGSVQVNSKTMYYYPTAEYSQIEKDVNGNDYHYTVYNFNCGEKYGLLVTMNENGDWKSVKDKIARFDQALEGMKFACGGSEPASQFEGVFTSFEFDSNGKLNTPITWHHGWEYPLASPNHTDYPYPTFIKNNGPALAMAVQLKPRCLSSYLVHKGGDIPGGLNKAWTDRVWEYAVKNKPGIFSLYYLSSPAYADPDLGIRRDLLNAPFGSLALSAIDKESAEAYLFTDKSFGVPLSCKNTLVEGSGSSGNFVLGDEVNAFCQGFDSTIGNDTLADPYFVSVPGLTVLKSLFVKAFDKWNLYNTGAVTAVQADNWAFFDDSGGFADADLKVPQIYALNPATCPSAGDKQCSAAEANAFTVNGRNYSSTNYNGDSKLIDEDNNNDGKPDSIISIGSHLAIVQFFAFADDNRMPIRRVMVDWGDYSPITNQDKMGLYKNRKPFCADTDGFSYSEQFKRCVNTQLTCRTDDDCKFLAGSPKCEIPKYEIPATTARYFGDAPRACKPTYFEFTHNYDCSKTSNQVLVSSLDAEAKTRLYGMGLKDSDKVCAFTPKVQVLDNWGWCNGDCLGVGKGCYNDEGTNGVKQCEIDPLRWTEYKGKIIVVPSK